MNRIETKEVAHSMGTEAMDALIARWRANTAAAGIRLEDSDIERSRERGALDAVLAVEAILDRSDARTMVPDYLATLTAPDADTSMSGAGAGATAAGDAGQSASGTPLHLSLEAAAARVARREISAVELTTLALEAAEAANAQGNAFRVFTRERALAAAERVDAAIASGAEVGPLAGIPLGMKDLLDMVGETTAAGSRVLADAPAQQDAPVVRLLEEAGATIIGKTSMPEFAFSPGSNNDHYGPVPNPWDATRDSGGSSSGSGAAVAAGLVFGATGSDTGGSIRMPASACGIVGFKPTFGAVSAAGAVSLSWSLDHVGPMTRTVRDAALMFDVMAGPDGGDARTQRAPYGAGRSNGTLASVEAGVAGLRVGVLSDDGNGSLGTPAVLAGLDASARALETAGAQIAPVAITESGALARLYGALLVIEASAYYEVFLRERRDELTRFSLDRLLLAYAYSPTFFVAAQQARAVLRARIEALTAEFDLLLLPGMPHEAPPLGVVQSNTRFTGPFNALGWPAVVVPSGRGEGGLPVAAQVAAKPWRDDLALRGARVIEQAGLGPGMPPTAASV